MPIKPLLFLTFRRFCGIIYIDLRGDTKNIKEMASWTLEHVLIPTAVGDAWATRQRRKLRTSNGKWKLIFAPCPDW